MTGWIIGCVLTAFAAAGTAWWINRSLRSLAGTPNGRLPVPRGTRHGSPPDESANPRPNNSGAGRWRTALNRVAGRLAVFTCVLVLLLSTLFAAAPYTLVQGLTMLAALCASTVVMAWLTASVAGGRRGRRVWLLAPVWAALALGGSWMVGYAMAVRGNLIKYAGGVHDLTPFGYGAWFGGLVLVLGVLHLRWLRGLTHRPA